MSKFCGKCDVYDSFIAIQEMDDTSDWSKVSIFQCDEDLNKHDLNIKSYKDLVPYFPHLVQYSSSRDGEVVACITNKSFVDMENEERINGIYYRAKRYYNRCKRKGIDFDIEEALKHVCFSSFGNDLEREVCERVKKHPYAKNDLTGLYYSFYEHYKEALMLEMLKSGYTEKQARKWCYEGVKIW